MDVALSQYEAEGTRPAWQAVDGPDEWGGLAARSNLADATCSPALRPRPQ